MELFYELVQVALGQRESLSCSPSDADWGKLYTLSQKQAITGVALIALEKLSQQGQKPPMAILYEWIGLSERIKAQNLLLNKRCGEISNVFSKAGFRTCILKGQGNALMYPNPYSRTSGDIDIWVDGSREEINNFVKTKLPDAFEQEHHIDFPIFKDVEVEVHYTPGTLLSPKCNRRFQQWCEKLKNVLMPNEIDLPEGAGRICVPTTEFNLVFQMAHIMIHFFIEGIGLRHFIDYYYVLRANTNQRSTAVGKVNCTNITNLFEDFGLMRFARGVMWIEKECLGLEDKYLLVEPDERRGKVILEEMLEGGNFGHHDERYKSRNKGYLARGITDVYRLLKLSTVFPSESMWKIYRKLENQKWKLKS